VTTVNRKDGAESTLDVRLEGLTLRVADVARSIEFYGNKLGFAVEINKAPQFAMMRIGKRTGGTIGLLAHDNADPLGSKSATPRQRAGIHVELTTDHLDALYEQLKSRG
jgi:catechol 2,3-dioxygenase-like lactoylglutathione lyase family enzyme